MVLPSGSDHSRTSIWSRFLQPRKPTNRVHTKGLDSRSEIPSAALAKALNTLTCDPLLLENVERKQPVKQSVAEGSGRSALAIHEPSASSALSYQFGSGVNVSFPVALRVRHGQQARPDLQLQLIEFRAGTAVTTRADKKASAEYLFTAGVADLATRGAALAFLALLFPGTGWPLLQRAAAVGVTSSVFVAGRRSALKRGWKFPRKGLVRSVDLKSRTAVRTGAIAAAQAVHETCVAAAVMAAALVALHKADDHAFHLLRCLAMSVTLNAGYARTARQTARGRFRQGTEAEQALRLRHRWAAQQVAPLMRDLNATPPLRHLARAQELLSLASAHGSLAVAEALLPGTGQSLGNVAFWGSIGIPKQGQQPAPEPDFSVTSVPLSNNLALQQPNAAGAGTFIQSQALPLQEPTAARKISTAAEYTAQVPSGPAVRPAVGLEEVLSAGLPTPDVGLPYPTSSLPTVRSRSEFLRVLQQQTQQSQADSAAPIQPCEVSTGGAAVIVDSASESFDDRLGPGDTSGRLPATSPTGFIPRASHPKAIKPAIIDSEPLAALYGRADHMRRHTAPLSSADRWALALRAFFLITVFAPFLLLGIPLLLIAACLPAQQKDEATVEIAAAAAMPANCPAAVHDAEGVSVGPASSMAQTSQAVSVEAVPPGLQGVLVTRGKEAPVRGVWLRRAAFNMLLFGCRNSGAAFIKWGQWASSRPDLLPEDLCEILTALQQDAPQHSYQETRDQVQRCFGLPIEAIFDSFEQQPLASASIAQVHKAELHVDGKLQTVAVKVRHPGVVTRITQDFQLLIPLARWSSKLRALKGLSLEQSVSQFSNTMTAQADLRVEAAHLRRFLFNFRRQAATITAPRPIDPWVAAGVLVETFEPGQSVERFIRDPQPFNTEIVGLGVNAYLQMLLEDSYVHTDLHPGNIFVSRQECTSRDPKLNSSSSSGGKKSMRMTLLDFGLAEELTSAVRFHFISFLHMISAGNGSQAAKHLLAMGDNALCPDVAGFESDMVALFNTASQINSPGGIDVDTVLKAVLKLARKHEVAIDSSYAALVLGVCVIVGFATGLDPKVNLMDAATPCLFANDLFGKVPNNLYS